MAGDIHMVARGNEGVAGRIKHSWGSIGYVEYGFAKRLGLPMVHFAKQGGRYVEPSPKAVKPLSPPTSPNSQQSAAVPARSGRRRLVSNCHLNLVVAA
jgi:ABC-type phosphate transport system substrate-binding protein